MKVKSEDKCLMSEDEKKERRLHEDKRDHAKVIQKP